MSPLSCTRILARGRAASEHGKGEILRMKRRCFPRRACLWSLLLEVLLSLLVCGCARSRATPSEPTGDDEIIGQDWRVWGLIQDSGTIVRNGEETEVLVCVYREQAFFYYDTDAQELYDFVGYPAALQGDPAEQFCGISFADRDGDGNSDVEMIFEENGAETRLVWLWDRENDGYQFQPEQAGNE